MFLFPAQRAFAQIEVVEFSDGSRLIKFAKDDLKGMDTEDVCICPLHCLDCCGACGSVFCIMGLGMLIPGIVTAISAAAGDILYGLIAFFPILIVEAMLWECGCLDCFEGCCDKFTDSYRACCCFCCVSDIEHSLKRALQHETTVAGESRPLLQGGVQNIPAQFLLFERPEDKVNLDPKPFLTTDRDTNYSQSLRSNGFAGFIRNIAGQLRTRGIRVKTRYYLRGTVKEAVFDPHVMPEVDGVEVVVDD